jgi:hypothetical protein
MRISLSMEFRKRTSYYTFSSPSITIYRLWRYPNSKAPYSAQYQQGDDQLDNKFNEHLNKFYDKVIAHLRKAESVLIFGPGEAKHELEKRIAQTKIKVRIVGVESADKMTERQVTSKVRNYFQ